MGHIAGTAAQPATTAGGRPRVESVAVELIAFCNQKCDYCYNEWREDGGISLSARHAEGTNLGATRPSQLSRVARLIAAWQIDHVTLTGGEPLASRELFPVLDLLKQNGVGVQMISNGGLVTPDLAKRLAGYDLRFVQITLNGSCEALHAAHVGPGHFHATLSGVRSLRANGVPVVGCSVVTRKNAGDVGAILELWRELGVEHIALSRFSPAGYATRHAAELLPSRSDLRTAFAQAQALVSTHPGLRVSCTMPVPPCAVEVEEFPDLRFGTCPIGTPAQEFALGPDGKLRNCTLHRTAIGGVDDILDPAVDLAALLQAPEVTQYRRSLPDFCQGCLHASTCAGGCGAAAEWVLGHARQFPDPLVWQHVDDEFADTLHSQRQSAAKKRLELIL